MVEINKLQRPRGGLDDILSCWTGPTQLVWTWEVVGSIGRERTTSWPSVFHGSFRWATPPSEHSERGRPRWQR